MRALTIAAMALAGMAACSNGDRDDTTGVNDGSSSSYQTATPSPAPMTDTPGGYGSTLSPTASPTMSPTSTPMISPTTSPDGMTPSPTP